MPFNPLDPLGIFERIKQEIDRIAGSAKLPVPPSPPGRTTKPPSIGNPRAPTKEVLKLEMRIPLELLWKDEPNYLEELTRKVKEFGITEPIEIRVREDGSMIVWDGLHRLAVAQKLGIEEVPVIYSSMRGV